MLLIRSTGETEFCLIHEARQNYQYNKQVFFPGAKNAGGHVKEWPGHLYKRSAGLIPEARENFKIFSQKSMENSNFKSKFLQLKQFLRKFLIQKQIKILILQGLGSPATLEKFYDFSIILALVHFFSKCGGSPYPVPSVAKSMQ